MYSVLRDVGARLFYIARGTELLANGDLTTKAGLTRHPLLAIRCVSGDFRSDQVGLSWIYRCGPPVRRLGPRRPVGGAPPVRSSQAFVIDFQCLSRSAINAARCRSSPPSKMLMSSGSAR